MLARDARRLRSRRLTALPSILANEKNNAKFNFLVPGDPYHAYYEQKARSNSSFCTAALIPPLRCQVAFFRAEDGEAKPQQVRSPAAPFHCRA